MGTRFVSKTCYEISWNCHQKTPKWIAKGIQERKMLSKKLPEGCQELPKVPTAVPRVTQNSQKALPKPLEGLSKPVLEGFCDAILLLNTETWATQVGKYGVYASLGGQICKSSRRVQSTQLTLI